MSTRSRFSSQEARVVRHFALSIGFALTVACALGCSTSLRSMTATALLAPPGGAEAAPPGGSATPGAPSAGGMRRQYYLTYWEGSCGGIGGGCSRGESHVRRCKVNADNTMTCVDEADATKALNP
jgi:hypothetical protein